MSKVLSLKTNRITINIKEVENGFEIHTKSGLPPSQTIHFLEQAKLAVHAQLVEAVTIEKLKQTNPLVSPAGKPLLVT